MLLLYQSINEEEEEEKLDSVLTINEYFKKKYQRILYHAEILINM